MNDHLPNSVGADYLRPSQQSCPQCGQVMDRIHRRPIDKLLSIFKPVQRYHCRNFTCRWEGNLRVRPDEAQASSLQ